MMTNDFPVFDIPEYGRDSTEWSGTIVFVGKCTMETDEKDLLQKILAAIGKDYESVQIVHVLNNQKLRLSESLDVSVDYTLFLFGLNPSSLGLQIDPRFYRCLRIGKWKIINCHTLSFLMKNRSAKKALWESMKNHLLEE